MSLISSGIMGLDGLVYCGLGVGMLFPAWEGHRDPKTPALSALYPSIFKRFVVVEPEEDGGGGEEVGEGTRDPMELVKSDLSFRLLGYLVLILGVCRVVTSFYWGCGYIYLGLGTCVIEIAIVCNELLRHDSMHLHRAMAVLFENMVLSLLYMSTAVPHCT
jgi:hypothetical protein